jgi:ubiquitin carboxyl-terminal hydrolase 8
MHYKIVGIQNLGNTCFLNSCVQILLVVPEMADICKSYVSKEKYNSALLETRIFNEWIRLIEEIISTKQNQINPLGFVKEIHHLAKHRGRELFTGWAQNDMSEFLLFFFDCLHTCICRPVKMNINGKTVTPMDKLAIECYHMLGAIYKKEYSEIMDAFYGIYVSEIFSTNLESLVEPNTPPNDFPRLSTKAEHYFILDLPIPAKPRSIDLYDCFDQFVEMETLYISNDSGWYNETTKSYEDAYRRIVFWNFPKVLVLSLKRFDENGRKRNVLVKYPLTDLDLSKYVCGYTPNKYVYELIGICNHYGNTMGGHYTSFVKLQNQWYHCNDSNIQPIMNETEVVTQNAYCLFYRKKYQ